MCMQIPLSNGEYLIVDDQEYERVSKHGWCLGLNNHVVANIKNRSVLLSQFLMGKAPAGMGIIHINYFESEIEAARAYDKAALAYYGKYAKLNLPQECYDVA